MLLASLKRSCSSFKLRNLGSPIYNRVYRLIVTRDPGKPIYKASSLVALINGLIRAIKDKNLTINIESITNLIIGHESSLNAGILYRNVSISNIILIENKIDGFLINYDLTIKTSNDRASGASSKTSTKVFIAIGALRGESYSFIYNLESFF